MTMNSLKRSTMHKLNRNLHASAPAFTLMEVVIALAITAFIVTCMYSFINNLLRTKNLLDEEREIGIVATTIIDRLTRELQLATAKERLLPPRNNTSERYNDSVDLIGEHHTVNNQYSSDSITFMASGGGQYILDGYSNSGIVQLSYRMVEDPDTKRLKLDEKTYYLVREETPFSQNTESDKIYSKSMTFPITPLIVSLRFHYFDGDKESWMDEWDEKQNKLPKLIRFSFKLQSSSGNIFSYSTIVPIMSK